MEFLFTSRFSAGSHEAARLALERLDYWGLSEMVREVGNSPLCEAAVSCVIELAKNSDVCDGEAAFHNIVQNGIIDSLLFVLQRGLSIVSKTLAVRALCLFALRCDGYVVYMYSEDICAILGKILRDSLHHHQHQETPRGKVPYSSTAWCAQSAVSTGATSSFPLSSRTTHQVDGAEMCIGSKSENSSSGNLTSEDIPHTSSIHTLITDALHILSLTVSIPDLMQQSFALINSNGSGPTQQQPGRRNKTSRSTSAPESLSCCAVIQNAGILPSVVQILRIMTETKEASDLVHPYRILSYANFPLQEMLSSRALFNNTSPSPVPLYSPYTHTITTISHCINILSYLSSDGGPGVPGYLEGKMKLHLLRAGAVSILVHILRQSVPVPPTTTAESKKKELRWRPVIEAIGTSGNNASSSAETHDSDKSSSSGSSGSNDCDIVLFKKCQREAEKVIRSVCKDPRLRTEVKEMGVDPELIGWFSKDW